ncbi:hypothetical protein D3C86_2072620 [compost metagenome]
MPFAPHRGLTVEVDQVHIVFQNVRHNGINEHNGLFLDFRVVDQLRCRAECENMTDHLVATRG